MFYGLMPLPVSAAVAKIMYKSDGKIISYLENDLGCRQFLLNNIAIFDGKYFCADDWRVYNTPLKNTVVLYFNGVEANAFSGGKTWNFLNLDSRKNFSLFEEHVSELYGHRLYINDSNVIADRINENKCVGANVASMSQANKAAPVFSGLLLNGKTAYTTNSSAPLKCIYDYAPEGGETKIAQVIESTKNIMGVKKDLNVVYFSVTGSGWTAYYAYDIKASKITKTTLANINKNKIELTRVYTNEKHNFSFQSLPGWHISATDDESDVSLFNKDLPSGGDSQIIMGIKDNAIFNDVVDASMKRYNSSEYCEIKKVNIVIAGVSGVRIERVNRTPRCNKKGNCPIVCVDVDNDDVVFEKNNKIFLLSSAGGSKVNENFNKIIKTLKADLANISSSNIILFQTGDLKLSYVNDNGRVGRQKNKFFVNGNVLFNDAYIDGENFKLFSTNQKNEVVLYYELNELGTNKYWDYVSLASSAHILINESDNKIGSVEIFVNGRLVDSGFDNNKFMGISSDYNKLYFSSESNGVKSNYSYNISTYKIVKEDSKNKIELALVKSF